MLQISARFYNSVNWKNANREFYPIPELVKMKEKIHKTNREKSGVVCIPHFGSNFDMLVSLRLQHVFLLISICIKV